MFYGLTHGKTFRVVLDYGVVPVRLPEISDKLLHMDGFKKIWGQTPRKARFSRILRSSPAIYTAKSRFANPAADAIYICGQGRNASRAIFDTTESPGAISRRYRGLD